MKEEEVKNKLSITNWSELSTGKVEELLKILPNIDAETFNKILTQAPDILNQTKSMLETFKNCMQTSKEMSDKTKDYYINLTDKLLPLMENKDLSDELKLEVKDLLVQIINKMEKLDEQDKEIMNLNMKKIWDCTKYLLVATVTVGAVATKFFHDNKKK